MRLANHLYTHNEVEISEGLGEGRNTFIQSVEYYTLCVWERAGMPHSCIYRWFAKCLFQVSL